MSWISAISDFFSGLANYNDVPQPNQPHPDTYPPNLPRPRPTDLSAPTAIPADVAARGWSKSLLDCHPRIQKAFPLVQKEFLASYSNCKLLVDYTYRSPAFQFELFKKGRTQDSDGNWVVVDKSQIVTEQDGYKIASHHNVYPAQAADIYIVQDGKVLWDNGPLYIVIGNIWVKRGLISGATWKYSWKDHDHVQCDYKMI